VSASSALANDVTLSHEMKHVEVFRQALDRAARNLELDLPKAAAQPKALSAFLTFRCRLLRP
jgi:hypothetical protein